eukprot:3169609-Amphidinium_carterae.1
MCRLTPVESSHSALSLLSSDSYTCENAFATVASLVGLSLANGCNMNGAQYPSLVPHVQTPK